jgi:hypothetical protein
MIDVNQATSGSVTSTSNLDGLLTGELSRYAKRPSGIRVSDILSVDPDNSVGNRLTRNRIGNHARYRR